MDANQGAATIVLVGLGAVALMGIAVLVFDQEDDTPDEEKTWWVLLYNYEKGNPDRRIKSWAGPFATKAEADQKADAEKDVWFPSVRKLAPGETPANLESGNWRRRGGRGRTSKTTRRRGRRRN